MVKIKLARFGKKGIPSYRIVVAEEANKRQGKIIDHIGFFTRPNTLSVDHKKLNEWIAKGAQPTSAVRKIVSL